MKNTINLKTVFTAIAIVLGVATTSAQEVKDYDQGFRLGFGLNISTRPPCRYSTGRWQ